MRVVALPYLTHMPFHIAKAEGYFEEQGLDVEFLMLGRNQDVMAALAQGDVDAMAGMLTLNELSLAASGARLRVVAALTAPPPKDSCSQTAILIRREHLDSGAAADPDRIRRMRVDVDLFIPLAYAVDDLLRTFGLTIDDVATVNLTPPVAVEAMASGQIDVTAESEPFVSRHLRSGQVQVWRSVHDLQPEHVQSVMVFGPRLLDDRPDVGQRFMTAVLKAVRRYRLGKTAENLALVEQASGLTADEVAGACWPTPTEHARIGPSAFRRYQEWLVGRGLLTRVLSDDELVDHRFVDHANAELAR